LDKNHIASQNMGDSSDHIFITPYMFVFTLFSVWHGVGIHSVKTKKKLSHECYHIDIKENVINVPIF
jgi:hypothetical protein